MYFMKKSSTPSQPFVFKPENHRVEPSDPGYFINPGPTGSGYLHNPNFSGYPPPSPAKPPPALPRRLEPPRGQRERRIPELEEVSDHEVIKQVYRQRPKRTPLKKVKETVPLPEEVATDSETVSTFSGSDVESDFHYVKSSNSSSGQETIMETESYGNKKGISSFSSLSIRGTREIKEVVEEIKSEFEIASSCGKEVAMLLEVSKLPYQHKDKGGFKDI
ncbi:hypothetical protein Bca52824_085075 [Brassica carinata]|uniref:DUF632 domain-containing protein n=1 Tax=Brassica carinata TaxID=52824 RepID=A0A8X7TV81_BRACI|nr:hypothetical protein Bca52824_085075 [Brassica carinata]